MIRLQTIKQLLFSNSYKRYKCIEFFSSYEDATLPCLNLKKNTIYLIDNSGYVCFDGNDNEIPILINKINFKDIDKYFIEC